jgi:hypothetical protein
MLGKQVVARLVGLAFLFSYVGVLEAQLNRGVIEGTVNDPQGAVVPGVNVTITSQDTNVSVPSKTNSTGYYRVIDLVPGKYKAKFEVSGFSTLELNDIEIPAGKVTRMDAQLKIGESTQLVEVTAQVPLLETGASNFSTTLETNTIVETPLAGRDIQQLAFLVPGVNNVAGPPGSNFGFNSQYGTFPDPTYTQGSNLAVNGGNVEKALNDVPKEQRKGMAFLVENMPDGNAYRPGDIVKTMSGQTIEIINTDAEGRLVLADVLHYVNTKYKPKFMVNLATLTGAIIVALGQEYAGMFGNDDRLCTRLTEAGLVTGERVWRMPLGPEYDKMIDSKFADMKNTGGRYGGSITAAQLLQRFVGKTPWAHLDIAGTALGSPQTDINKSWSSGWGVRLLNALVADHYEK